MYLALVIREIGGHFLADEGVRQMGYFKAALNGIMISDGHKRHAPLLCDVVNMRWFGEALRTAYFLQNPLCRTFGKL